MKKRITFNGCQGIRVSLLFLNINLFSFGNDRFKFNENRFPSHLIRSAIVLRSGRKSKVHVLFFGIFFFCVGDFFFNCFRLDVLLHFWFLFICFVGGLRACYYFFQSFCRTVV